MGKGDSGATGGTWTGEQSGGNASLVQLAGREVMQDIARALNRASTSFPEVRAYANITEIQEGDFRGSTLGTYGNGYITIQTGLRSGTGRNSRAWVAAHETAHGLTVNAPSNYRTPEQTMRSAIREYNRANPTARLTQAGLAGQVSNYARSSPREAISEAFADWSVRGNRASEASRIIMRNWRR